MPKYQVSGVRNSTTVEAHSEREAREKAMEEFHGPWQNGVSVGVVGAWGGLGLSVREVSEE